MKLLKTKLLICSFFLAFMGVKAQETMVSGTVNEKDGATLVGATVAVKGTTNGVVTDIDGQYAIKYNPEESTTLVFSYIGFQSVEIPINNQSRIDVTLKVDMLSLEDIVVVGYGIQKKSLVTGSISKIEDDELIANQPSRVEQAIQGKVAGVSISSESGSPGGALTVKIRGTSSNKNTNPLFIVDGMKTGGIDFLNPSDIESIEILKDAASSAIYGAEGGNGVVLITTKKGRAGRTEVSYDVYYGIQKFAETITLLDGAQYVDYFQKALYYENSVANATDESNVTLVNSKLDKLKLPILGETTDMNTNWLDEVTNVAPMVNHNLNLSGGNESTQYSASISYTSQKGITGGDKSRFDRITARLNVEHQVTPWLKAGIKSIYSNKKRSALSENSEFGGVFGNALMLDPLTPAIYETDADINPEFANAGFDDLFVRNSDGQAYGMSSYVKNEVVNPLAQIEASHGSYNENKILAGAYLEFEFIKGLKYKSSYDIDVANGMSENWDQTKFYHNLNRNDFSSASMTVNKYDTWQFDNVISYAKNIDKHSISVMVGSHAEEYIHKQLYGWGKNLIREDDAFSHPANALNDSTVTIENVLGGYNADPIRLASVFGRLTYNYDERYLLNITIRNDRSSKLSPKDNNQSGIFPSASLGWVASNEEFWSSSFISFMKARYSYGTNGSLGSLAPFDYVPLISFSGNVYADADGNVLQGATPLKLSNDALKWETTTMHDAGIDFKFLSGNLGATIDYYYKKTTDLLTDAPIAGYVGNAAPQANAGTVVNNGLELELSYYKNKGDFNYSISANASFLKNEVVFIGNASGDLNGAGLGTAGLITKSTVGAPLWSFYGYQVDGIWKSAEDIAANNYSTDVEGKEKVIQNNAMPGDIKVVDVNEDNVINVDDRTLIGSPHPDFLAGLNANFSYKGFDLGLNFIASVGNDVYFGVYRSDLGLSNKPSYFLTDAWSPENTDATFFRPTYASSWNFQHNSMFVEDGSYLKLKNLQLGYTIPRLVSEKIDIKRLRIYFSANNLLTITKYHGADPEMGYTQGIQSYGIDRGFYPQARQFIMGLNVSF
ncbi:MAG: TonB-dependent receptor [Prolixibacteraceae bacterium]|jgi:TonB-linked SusC/RagA family outer membrane protein|nr:TonB-dependent receptor [Prolixibacteraceae bacterium]